MTGDQCSTLGMIGDYNEHSILQLNIINSMKNVIHLGIDQFDVSLSSLPLILADFGSSHGKNSIEAMKQILSYLRKTGKLVKSVMVIHNDLPTNNWTKLFQLLEKDNSYHAVANGHSFYDQCLPSNSVSIAFSSTSIQWLSKIPLNISNHCYFTFAKENERQAFKDQAKSDFSSFIEYRSKELLPGGILILSTPSVDHQGNACQSGYADVLYSCAQLLFTPKELLKFTIPVYLRSLSECVDYELFDRCSLQLIKAELGQVKLALFEHENVQPIVDHFHQTMVNIMQSSFGSIVRQTLENNGRSKDDIEQVLLDFWTLFGSKLKDNACPFGTSNERACVYLILKKINEINK